MNKSLETDQIRDRFYKLALLHGIPQRTREVLWSQFILPEILSAGEILYEKGKLDQLLISEKG